MQVIMSTFRAYHWPGTSWDIYDPLANIAAALNYARHVYGPSLRNASGAGIGSGHGYAEGGLVPGYASGGLIPGYASGGTPTFLDPKAAAWLKRYNAAQKAEYRDYVGFTQAWRKDLKHPEAGSFAAGHAKTLLSELGTLDKRQRAEDAAYDAILHLGVTSKTTGHLRSLIGEELTTSRDKTLSYGGRGGHAGWLSGMRYWLGQINTLITHTPAANILPAGVVTEHVPGSVKDIHLGPVHSVPGGVLTFDKGGYLPPGLTVAYNGTGKPEPVVPGAGGSITVVIENNGVIGSQQEMDTWLQNSMNRLARNGKLTQAVNTAVRRR
jgi:hypothetical protein